LSPADRNKKHLFEDGAALYEKRNAIYFILTAISQPVNSRFFAENDARRFRGYVSFCHMIKIR